jgi:penicillin-binding protein 2
MASSRRLRRAAAASAPPAVDAQLTLTRLRVFACVLAALIAMLSARLWYLQVLRGQEFRNKAATNRARSVRSVAPRGAVEDAKGRVLITNSAQFTVFVLPSDLPKKDPEKDEILGRLAEILDLSLAQVKAILKRNWTGPSHPIAVAEGVSDDVLAKISENRLWLPGVSADVEPVRRYPNGLAGAHLLGYIGQITEKQFAKKENKALGYQQGDLIGQSGVERQYDYLLNGTAGGTDYEVDAKGRRLRALGTQDPVPGATLRLAMDLEVQKAAEKGLAGRKGAAVAIDPRDGRVIAMASFPAFNPNLLARRPLKQKVYKEQIEPGLFNRATMAEMPPGSTYKIVTSAAGLAMGRIDANTSFYCGGGINIGKGFFKHCHSTHGSVNLNRALAASCDVYYYRLGEMIGPTQLAAWSKKFGLGEGTGIDFPSDQDGIIPSPAWKKKMAPIFKNPDDNWYPGDTANMAIGQGDVLTTPLQMAQVAGAIGNGGTVWKPRVLLRAISSADKNKVLYEMKPEASHQLGLTSEQLHLIAQGMRSVIAGPGGTGHAANLSGVMVAGKSGSAEKRGTGGGRGATHAWFVCYAPYDNPTIAVCVFLESEGQNYHGGADAAPIARKMLAAHFRVPDQASSAGGGRIVD